MIDLYMWSTTNSRRASIGLEEAGLEYNVHPININEKDQFTPEHTARNPYQKVPVIVDHDGPGGVPVTVFMARSGFVRSLRLPPMNIFTVGSM